MRIRSISRFAVAAIAIALLLAAVPTSANNPILVTSTGAPYKWNSFPITYTVDGGNLGALTNADANALTAQAFGVWTSVPTASLSVTQNPVVGLADGDVNTVAEYSSVTGLSSCISANPVIYDSDGSITDGLFGVGASNSILGFAGPCAINFGGAIGGMAATLNGKFVAVSPVSALARSLMLGVLIHELGHALGLGHSQVNLNCLTNAASCPSNAAGGDIFGVPTMFPIALSRTESTDVTFMTTLAADDASAISILYPKQPDFGNSTGTIAGIVFFGDGVNHFQGANVIARRVGDPRVTAVSNVSGMFAQVDHGNSALGSSPSPFGSVDATKRGQYTIPGLPPGTYTVEVESVRSTFIGGSSVGPVGEERGENIPVPAAEFFGGPESNTDNPGISQTLVLAAGNVLGGNNFILNDTLPTMDAFDTAARNETIATATPIAANLTAARSISGTNGLDVDVYSINVPAGQVLSVETISRRRSPQGYLDSVIELMNASGSRLTDCRIGSNLTPYNQTCLDDDFGFSLDSKLDYAGSPGTVYLLVTDALGDFRPDFVYDVGVSFAVARAEVAPQASPANFDPQFVNVPPPEAKAFIVTNIGSLNMTLSASPITINNNFATPNSFVLASGSTCTGNLVLPPGTSCTVNVTFAPTVVKSVHSGSFSVFSNAFLSPQVFNFNGVAVDFAVKPANSVSVPAGQLASFGIFFTHMPDSVGLPAVTTFTVSGLPAGTSASFNPPSLPSGVSQGGLATITLNVTTTTRSATVPSGRLRLRAPPVSYYFLVCLIAFLIILALTWHNPDVPWPLKTCAMLALLCVFATLGACGGSGSGSGSGGGGSGSGGTPAGTYPLTVTATSGPVTHTTAVSLNVQ